MERVNIKSKQNTKKLLRLFDLKQAFGIGKTTAYAWLRDGLLTPPVRLGRRMVAWPDNEVNALVAARILGKSDDVIKALVIQLMADRQAVSEV